MLSRYYFLGSCEDSVGNDGWSWWSEREREREREPLAAFSTLYSALLDSRDGQPAKRRGWALHTISSAAPPPRGPLVWGWQSPGRPSLDPTTLLGQASQRLVSRQKASGHHTRHSLRPSRPPSSPPGLAGAQQKQAPASSESGMAASQPVHPRPPSAARASPARQLASPPARRRIEIASTCWAQRERAPDCMLLARLPPAWTVPLPAVPTRTESTEAHQKPSAGPSDPPHRGLPSSRPLTSSQRGPPGAARVGNPREKTRGTYRVHTVTVQYSTVQAGVAAVTTSTAQVQRGCAPAHTPRQSVG